MARSDENYFDINENKENTIENILDFDEHILVDLKPDRKDYILESIFKGLPIVIIWAAFDTFFIYMMTKTGIFETSIFVIIFVAIFFAFHLIPVWAYIANILKRTAGYKKIGYYFTDKRVIIKSGLISENCKYIYYQDIKAVNVKVGLFDKLFKVGDVYLMGVNNYTLEDIKHPVEYANKIQKIINDIKTDIEFPNKYRPDENPGFNTTYKFDDK